jgi:transposase
MKLVFLCNSNFRPVKHMMRRWLSFFCKICPRATSLLADRGYDADWIRELIKDQGCTPVIPPKSNRRKEVPFSKHKYKKRNLVERCINKLKQFRHIATRYDRHASAYLAFAKLAAVRLWLRFYESTA